VTLNSSKARRVERLAWIVALSLGAVGSASILFGIALGVTGRG